MQCKAISNHFRRYKNDKILNVCKYFTDVNGIIVQYIVIV